MDEAVLLRQVGVADVMADQLRRLHELSGQPDVMLPALPYFVGAHLGVYGALILMSLPDPADLELVYFGSRAGALFLEKEADSRRYAEMFDHLRCE